MDSTDTYLCRGVCDPDAALVNSFHSLGLLAAPPLTPAELDSVGELRR